MRAISSAAVVKPVLSICSRVTTCTGSAVSEAICLMADPVISTLGMGASRVWASAAWLNKPAAAAPSVRRTARASGDSIGDRVGLVGAPGNISADVILQWCWRMGMAPLG